MPTLEALSRYRFANKSERAVREEWIRPLLEHLGYGIDTLNDVLSEERLLLRNPRRRIGSETRMVDYTPTVLGHGLWIIEAKAPEARDSWDDALSQAWLYATHPDVDVPFMMIADGQRLTVHEVVRTDWDTPILDIGGRELRNEFGRLMSVLGAAHVAEAVRVRQLRHLGMAMRAELDPARLEETVDAVRRLAADALPVVVDNRRRILQDRFAREADGQDDLARTAGVWGIAQMHNQPLPENLADVDRAVAHVRALPEFLRGRELDQFADATRGSGSGEGAPDDRPPARMFWMLRLVALHTYLRLLHDPGCGEHATHLARQAFRDHLLGFPDDPVAAAAHRLERVLPVFVLRMALAIDDVDLPGAARRMTAPMDDEALLRGGVDADVLLLRLVSMTCRRTFGTLDWTVEELTGAAEPLERTVTSLEYRKDRGQGQAHDPFLEHYLRNDALVEQTLTLAAAHRGVLDAETLAVVP